MRKFLSIVTVGELVAASDCRIFSEYFLDKGIIFLSSAYKKMEEEELFHFRMLKKELKIVEDISDKIKCVFRGKLLGDHTSIPEKLALMHGVFEPAAFSYMSVFSKLESSEFQNLRNIAKTIMVDEANHMSIGGQALSEIKKLDNFKKGDIKESILRHASALREISEDCLEDYPDLSHKMIHIFNQNIDQFTRRFFQ